MRTFFGTRSNPIAAGGFGLAGSLSVIVLGDESGYTDGRVQKVKLAAIEAEWESADAPAPFTLFGLPDQDNMETDYSIKVPWLLGLIATRSVSEKIIGIKELLAENELKVRQGQTAYGLLESLKKTPNDAALRAQFLRFRPYLGYGLLLKKYTDRVVDASDTEILKATRDTIPKVAPLFWTFRIMVACGFIMLLIFVLAFYACSTQKVLESHWLQRAALFAIPLPWIASETGWFVAEYGRQPWSIAEILPTHLSVSSRTPQELYLSLSAFLLVYGLLFIAEIFLMVKYVRLGPSSLYTGRYYFEKIGGAS